MSPQCRSALALFIASVMTGYSEATGLSLVQLRAQIQRSPGVNDCDVCPFTSIEKGPDFNLLICGDFDMPDGTGDTEGSLGVLGSFNIGNGYSISDKLPCHDEKYGLVVGGDMHWKSGAVMCDDVTGAPHTSLGWAVGGENSGAVPPGNCCDHRDPLPFDLSELCGDVDKKCLNMQDEALLLSVYGAANVQVAMATKTGGEIVLPIDESKLVNVISVKSSMLDSNVWGIKFQTNSGSSTGLEGQVIVNVISDTTSPVFIQSDFTLDGSPVTQETSTHIVWVKCDSSDLTLRWVTFKGNFLAPSTALTSDTSGQFNGRAVFGSYIYTDTGASTSSYATMQFNYNNGSYFKCECTTPSPPPAVTPPPSPCESGTCIVDEDPHILSLDDVQVSLLMTTSAAKEASNDKGGNGDRWLVKNRAVSIQARYMVDEDLPGENMFVRAVAVGGPFLEGGTLIVGSLEDRITWNGLEILHPRESTFERPNLVRAVRHLNSSLVEDTSKLNPGVDIDLPMGVRLTVNRLHHHVNVAISMPRLEGGQDGLCGNFNGVGSDDSLEFAAFREAFEVPAEQSLFRDF